MPGRKGVSRQRAWQLRKLGSFLCAQCGKRPLWQSHETCKECAFKRAAQSLARYHARKVRPS